MSEYDDVAWTETMAAAGWPEPCADDDAWDVQQEQTQAWYASPEGVAWQLAQAGRLASE